MSLHAADKLGPYEIVAPIGKGGMGEVWKARDPGVNHYHHLRYVRYRHKENLFQSRATRPAMAMLVMVMSVNVEIIGI